MCYRIIGYALNLGSYAISRADCPVRVRGNGIAEVQCDVKAYPVVKLRVEYAVPGMVAACRFGVALYELCGDTDAAAHCAVEGGYVVADALTAHED